MGEFVTKRFDYDGGRDVTAYVPRGPVAAVVFAGDGQVTAPWGADLEASDVLPTLVVGVHRAPDELLRLHEYSPQLDPQRFAAHERFLLEDVGGWVTSSLGVSVPVDRTAVFGVSAGGELALALGLRHPEVFGAMLCASPGAGYAPPSPLPAAVPRAYLVAGTEEPFFRDNAARWAEALHQGGGHVVMTVRAGPHGGAFWRDEFPVMVAWAFNGQVVRCTVSATPDSQQCSPLHHPATPRAVNGACSSRRGPRGQEREQHEQPLRARASRGTSL